MKRIILLLVIVLLFYIFYEKKADIGKEQQEFEATVDNFKKALDNVPAEIKKRKKEANNKYAEKKIESQEGILREHVYSGVSVFRSRVTPVKKFTGLVTGVDENGIVVVKNRNSFYCLIIPPGLDSRIALIAPRDELTFSGVIEGTGSVTDQAFLDRPIWKVAVSEFYDSAVEGRARELQSCIIKADTPIGELCDRLVRYSKLRETIKNNDKTSSYVGKFLNIPDVIDVKDFVVEFKEIEDVENIPDVATMLIGSASVVKMLIGGAISLKEGVQTVSYIAKSHGMTFRMPLFAGRGSFKNNKEKKELDAVKVMFANDNFKKGDKLKLTGKVSWQSQGDDMLVMVVSPGFALEK